ncbi:sigma-70 family RNA polymerase sigma factor [Fictibacillus norfolkensis]|uniref:Sigma-70 family RNA polymerase sigma factor n=1 Tax=Fictibacillus norfolkensis TaxID=2762233 RepID=A0ABR8SND6_9BACL|nr:sigma-70 family RNA polymerase sigma factor [Fictibacillus norfolkensis]MBD7964864.1 sigma-70 family RNA polymerase sigma factor [Fictibacillus norfolkensis]
MEPKITPEVIDRLKKGELTAFDEMYGATIHKVYRTVYVLAPNKQEVNEIVNEIYFQVWKSISNYNDSSPFLFWLNGLVFRQVKNWKMKAWKRAELLRKIKKFSLKESFVNDDILKSENQDEILSQLNTMPYKLKEVLLLVYFYDYPLKEIASLLRIPIGTVKSRHHTAIKYIQRQRASISGEVGINNAK